DDFRRYFVYRWSTSDREAMHLRLTSGEDLSARAELIERNVKQKLERLPGVARVEIEGVAPQELLVALDKDRLVAHGAALNDLVQRLRAAIRPVSAGRTARGNQRRRVPPRVELASLQALPERRPHQPGTRLSDVAAVELRPQ